jgi:hypothetical protein
MPSPFQQKYSSQSHKNFEESPVPVMPEAPKQDAERRASDSSMTADGTSPDPRRRVRSAPSPDGSFFFDVQSSAAQRFGNLEAVKRRQDDESMAKRESLHDSYGKPGVLGGMWNK